MARFSHSWWYLEKRDVRTKGLYDQGRRLFILQSREPPRWRYNENLQYARICSIQVNFLPI